MTPRQHATSTRVLAPPKGMGPDECQPLPITDTNALGGPACASFWYPSDAELELLNQGRGVCIVIPGTTHPPVMVGVDIYPQP